jgi:hypothetical protein
VLLNTNSSTRKKLQIQELDAFDRIESIAIAIAKQQSQETVQLNVVQHAI